MAHFAKISEENEVLQVVTFDDNILINNGVEDEFLGQQYLETHHNWPAHLWIKTSFNTFFNKHRSGDNSKAYRGNYAGVGYTWDSENQIFWHPKPYASWVKKITEARWESPLGEKPSLTEEQTSENTSGTHRWSYEWDENAYQENNTTGWVLYNGLVS